MEEEKKGFVIKDRRIFDETGAVRQEEEKREERKEKEEPKGEPRQEERYVEVNFTNFLLSLSSSAFYHFGDFPDPNTGKTQKNLPAAKQIIDTLAMLKTKTTGNLERNEEELLDHLLYELRMRFVKEAS